MKQVIIIILLCFAGIADICQAQVRPDRRDNAVIPDRRDNSVIPDRRDNSVRNDSSEIPNFEKCFRLLEENRRTYNRYNDSIFLIKVVISMAVE